jgi:hypothetical protein
LVSKSKLRQLEREAKEQLASLRVRLETETDVRALKRALSKSVDMAKPTGTPDSLDKANRTRRLSKQQALRRTADLLRQHPDLTPTQIAAAIGKSRGTVYDYLRELGNQANGNGVYG